MVQSRSVSVIAGALLMVTHPVWSAAQQMITLNVTLVAPACEINEGRPVEVDFGDNLQSSRLDGRNYLQPVSYQLSCSVSRAAGLTLTLSGEPAQFDSTVLATSMPDVAIRLLHNGQPVALNQPIALDIHQPPQLHAVPVKRAAAVIAKGRFTASATLRVRYF